MSNLLSFPLVEAGPKEEATPGTFGAATPLRFLPELKNYAKDEETLRYIQQELYPVMVGERSNRRPMEDEWESIRNMNLMKHDDGRRYFGRSDTYLPVYKRERAKLVSTLSTGLFPSDEYFDVIDLETGDPERARPVKQYMHWEMATNARLRSYMKPVLSSLVDYGTTVQKYWYKKEIRSIGKASRVSLKSLGAMDQAAYGFKPYKCEGLAVSPRNLLFWYIYPNTAESLEDALMVFEDIDVSHAFMMDMKRKKRWENVDELLGHWLQDDHARALQELLNTRGLGMQIPGRDAGEAGQIYTITEVWTNMVLPRDAYLDWENPDEPIPVRIAMMQDRPLEVRRNPFFHQKPPYNVGRIDWEPGLFYGNAQGRIIRPLQLLANDFMNQTNDNGILALNPITLMNPNMMVGPPRPFSPGVPWYVQDVNLAVKFERPPMEQVNMGHAMSQLIIGMAQDSGGAPPDRSTTSKGAKTATGMQILQKNALSPLQDVVEDIEVDMMVPLLSGAWRNAVQYRDEAVMTSVAGERIQIVPEMLAIEADFMWLASSQAQNAQVRNQQAMSLIQAVAPIVPLIVQQGYVVDFVSMIKKVFGGMGFRGFNEFIRKAQAVPGAMPGQLAPAEQLGGAQMEQQDNLRSALDQLGGGQQEMQPGEGQEFSEVRDQADQIAGQMGGMQ